MAEVAVDPPQLPGGQGGLLPLYPPIVRKGPMAAGTLPAPWLPSFPSLWLPRVSAFPSLAPEARLPGSLLFYAPDVLSAS
eukprot:CAMPEP_0184302074 /NCGR_PEP_ID=MMETSP1049-20130417/12138_1 /TAXON_ID=77928 /ORGANISM="Proteomonas sulcata, Strain CCMP704" /LENGTH=79 /DNA_ID=CAMNT_0026613257 /DNA_START=129 /DNA_END=368 /DNA_ORIENTATION=+